MDGEKAFAVAVAVAVVLVSSAGAASANHGTADSKSYVAPAPVAHTNTCTSSPSTNPGVGGVSFCEVGDAGHVTITVDDASGLETAAYASVQDQGGNHLLSETFCGETTLRLPYGADRVRVWVGHVDFVVFGGDPSCAGPATTGTVTAAWSE